MTGDTELVEAVSRDPERARLPRRARSLVDYAVRLARAPATLTEEHLAPLRGAGLSDRDIHDACAVASYYCFVNRVANGLGVELEESPLAP